jgi:hypothetical protein
MLNQLQTEIVSGDCEKVKLLACTYLLYVILYEDAYRFNPKQSMTFEEITSNVEKFGNDQLIKNLNQQIVNFNKVRQAKRQGRK